MWLFVGGAFGGFPFVTSRRGKLRSCSILGDQGCEVPLKRAFGGELICPGYFNFGRFSRGGCFGCSPEWGK